MSNAPASWNPRVATLKLEQNPVATEGNELADRTPCPRCRVKKKTASVAGEMDIPTLLKLRAG
jgi:hypothetical protein